MHAKVIDRHIDRSTVSWAASRTRREPPAPAISTIPFPGHADNTHVNRRRSGPVQEARGALGILAQGPRSSPEAQ